MSRPLPEGYAIVAKVSTSSGMPWYHLTFDGKVVASEMVFVWSNRHYIRKLKRLARLRVKHDVKEVGA